MSDDPWQVGHAACNAQVHQPVWFSRIGWPLQQRGRARGLIHRGPFFMKGHAPVQLEEPPPEEVQETFVAILVPAEFAMDEKEMQRLFRPR